jgi:hypothetical protein
MSYIITIVTDDGDIRDINFCAAPAFGHRWIPTNPTAEIAELFRNGLESADNIVKTLEKAGIKILSETEAVKARKNKEEESVEKEKRENEKRIKQAEKFEKEREEQNSSDVKILTKFFDKDVVEIFKRRFSI